MHFLMRRVSQKRCAGAWKCEYRDGRNDHHHWKHEDAAFGTGRAAAQPGWTDRMCREQTVRTDAAAVGHAEEERLCPVPRSVQTDGPPQRTRAPQAEGEHEARTTGAQKADGRLSGVHAVHKTEAEGD